MSTCATIWTTLAIVTGLAFTIGFVIPYTYRVLDFLKDNSRKIVTGTITTGILLGGSMAAAQVYNTPPYECKVK